MPAAIPPTPLDQEIARAVAILRAGGLVAFPTETVYGLGADAFNPVALERVFAVKRRPQHHPLIVHVASADALDELSHEVPKAARTLAARFWPGPLTLVLPRHPRVPGEVAGGQATLAVRVPNHPVALALLKAFGGAIAAPSANRFGSVSPTTAEHVRDDLGADVPCVLDGGPCEVGLESTIVDVTESPALVLRPGGVSEEALSDALGERVSGGTRQGVRVPGALASHYAPGARVVLVKGEELEAAARRFSASGAKVRCLVPEGVIASGLARVVPKEPEGYARALYESLRALDRTGADVILVVPPPPRGVGRAVVDRLERAAAPRPEPKAED